jgi:hypothetical protein
LLVYVGEYVAFEETGGESDADFKAQLDFLASNAEARSKLRATASAVVRPAVEWFQRAVLGPNGHLKDQLSLYEAARVISPHFLASHTAEQCLEQFRTLESCGLLTENDLKGVLTELPQVLQELSAHPPSAGTTTIAFWKEFKERFPAMCLVLRKIATLSQTSASVERVFSLLQQVFTAQQEASALGDYLEVALMCRYNFE